jgi:hypothetical protein
MRMVASNFFGLSSSFIKIFSRLLILLSSASKSEGFKENKATSDPETSAEQISKIITEITPMTSGKLN